MEEAINIPLKHKLLCPAAAATAAAAVAVAAGQAAAIAAVAVTVAVAVAIAVVVIVAGARAGAMTIASNAQGRLRKPKAARGCAGDAQGCPGEPRGARAQGHPREHRDEGNPLPRDGLGLPGQLKGGPGTRPNRPKVASKRLQFSARKNSKFGPNFGTESGDKCRDPNRTQNI